jgi:group I intron endonuclease
MLEKINGRVRVNVDHIPNVPGIYRIENTVNGKFYIGSAGRLRFRLNQHRAALRRGKHHNNYLQAAWAKYGEDSFAVEVVELVSEDVLLEAEQRHIDDTGAVERGYNLSPTAGRTTGWVQPDHVRMAVGEANRKRVWTDEMRANHSAAHKGIATDAMREQIRELGKRCRGKEIAESTREKLRVANLGKHHSDESRRKMSESRRGRPVSEDQKKKLSEIFKGRKFSKETIKRMSDAQRRRYGHEPENHD